MPAADATPPSPDTPQDHAGHERILSFSGYEQDALFFNKGDGTFIELGSASGVALPQDGRAVGAADFDRDGDLDLVTRNVYRKPLVVFRNLLQGRSVTVRLRGTMSNRFGIGARVTVGKQVQEMRCGSGYLSGNAPELHFGLPGDDAAIEVVWPSGEKTVVPSVSAGATVTISEDGKVERTPYAPAAKVEPAPRKRLLRAGDVAPGWRPDSVVAVWNSKCASCSKKNDLEALGATFVEEGFDGLIHAGDPLFPVVYKVGADGRVLWKWVGKPDLQRVGK